MGIRRTAMAMAAALGLVASMLALGLGATAAAADTATAITGVVTDSVSGAPIGGIRVQGRWSAGVVKAVSTAPDGTYTVAGLTPGTPYTLTFSDPAATPAYVPFTSAATVPAGTVAVALTPYTHIAGTATAAGLGLSGVQVIARTTDGSSVQRVVTGTGGTFDLDRVPAGASYRLDFSDTQTPSRIVAVNIPNIAGGTVGFTQPLTLYGHISGTTFSSSMPVPMPGVRVQARRADSSIVQQVTSDANGAYDLDRVPLGSTYRIDYTDPQSPPRFPALTLNAVSAGSTGVSPALNSYAHLSGTVINQSGGAGLADVLVAALLPDGSVAATAVTSAGGAFDLGRLANGATYRLRVSDNTAPERFAPVLGNFYGSGVSGIVQSVRLFAPISGVVRANTTSAVVAGVTVSAITFENAVVQSVTTDANGAFTLDRLTAGTVYQLRYQDGQSPERFISGVGGAYPAPTTGISQTLPMYGTISGRVRNAQNQANIAGIRVSAYLALDNSFQQSVVTGADGTFSLGELPAGYPFVLRYTDTVTPARFAPVTDAPTLSPSSNIVRSLIPLGSISGTAFVLVNGQPLSGVQVSALAADNSVVQSVVTTSNGGFTLDQLPANVTYRLRFTDTQAFPRFSTTVTSPVPPGISGFGQPLATYSGFQGTVRFFFGNALVSGVKVSALAPDNSVVQSVITGADGSFTLNRVPTGAAYRLEFSDSTGANRFSTAVASYPLGQELIVQLVL